MHFFVLIVLLFCVVNCELSWTEFKAKFGISYATKSEDEYRKGLYLQSLNEIKEISKRHPFATFGPNKFSVMTKEERRSYFSSAKFNSTETNKRLIKLEFNSKKRTHNYGNPDSFSYVSDEYLSSTIGPEWTIEKVEDQGLCGSCWAFATITLLNYAEVLSGKGLDESLSVMQLVNCDNYDLGCTGGNMYFTSKYLMETKTYYYESAFRYDLNNTQCSPNNSSYFKTLQDIDIYYVTGSEQNIMHMLHRIGPVYATIQSSYDLNYYQSGILSMGTCASKETINDYTDHAIVIVGYGFEDGQPYWLVRNSWGSDWGLNGYFKIYRGDDLCNIDGESTIAYGLTTKDCSGFNKNDCNGAGCKWCESQNACISVPEPCDECYVSCTGSCKKCGRFCVSSDVDCSDLCECSGGECCDGCHYLPSTAICRESLGICESDIYCTGTDSKCPSGRVFLGKDVVCRKSFDNDCDIEEKCTGYSASCPSDNEGGTNKCRNGKKVHGCISDADCSLSICSIGYCNITTKECRYEIDTSNTGKVCRSSKGDCDIPEYCDGSNLFCPEDKFKAEGTSCSFEIGFCLESAQCSGYSPDCIPTFKNSSTICREAENDCDVSEYCTGYSSECPPDITKAGESCSRNDYLNALCTDTKECLGEFTGNCTKDSDCNNGKNCTNYSCINGACSYSMKSNSTLCRPAINTCDVPEYCTGSSYSCPEDLSYPGWYFDINYYSSFNAHPIEKEDKKEEGDNGKKSFFIIAIAIILGLIVIVLIISLIVCLSSGKKKPDDEHSSLVP